MTFCEEVEGFGVEVGSVEGGCSRFVGVRVVVFAERFARVGLLGRELFGRGDDFAFGEGTEFGGRETRGLERGGKGGGLGESEGT